MAEPVQPMQVSDNGNGLGLTNTNLASIALLFIIILSVVYLNYFSGYQPDDKENPYGSDNPNRNVAFGGGRILQTINHDMTLSL